MSMSCSFWCGRLASAPQRRVSSAGVPHALALVRLGAETVLPVVRIRPDAVADLLALAAGDLIVVSSGVRRMETRR